MRHFRLSVFFCFALAVAGPASGQTGDVVIKDGFITGQAFLNLSQVEQHGYVMGVIDGAFLAPFFGAPKERVRWLETCTIGMTDSQIAALVRKRLRDAPEVWHLSASVAVYRAFLNVCPR